MFDIVIPLYNKKRYLEKAIYSIISQDFQQWRLFIVDDCSTDGSYELASTLAANDDRITVIRNERNMGVGFTRKRAIGLGRHPWVMFLDADDWWDNKMLGRVVGVIDKDLDYVCTNYYFEPRHVIAADIPSGRIENFYEFFIKTRGRIPITNAMAVRRDIIISIDAFPERMFSMEDNYTWMQVGRGPGFYIDTPLAVYLIDVSDSATKQAKALTFPSIVLRKSFKVPRRLQWSFFKVRCFILLGYLYAQWRRVTSGAYKRRDFDE